MEVSQFILMVKISELLRPRIMRLNLSMDLKNKLKIGDFYNDKIK